MASTEFLSAKEIFEQLPSTDQIQRKDIVEVSRSLFENGRELMFAIADQIEPDQQFCMSVQAHLSQVADLLEQRLVSAEDISRKDATFVCDVILATRERAGEVLQLVTGRLG